jgi:hypothetical protein
MRASRGMGCMAEKKLKSLRKAVQLKMKNVTKR